MTLKRVHSAASSASAEATADHRSLGRRWSWQRTTSLLRLITAVLVLLTAADRTEADSKSFLWKVSTKQNAVFLVGSVHMLTKDYYPLNPAFESAFKQSNLLVEEADLGQMASPQSQMLMLTRGMLPGNQSLDQVVSPATFELVSKHANEIGLPVEPLKRFKPWALALTLLGLEWQKAGFDADLGLDKHFYDLAQNDRKAVEGLETVDYQISRFDGLSMEQQERLLADTLKGGDTEMMNVSKLADAWKAGDAPTVERIVLKDLEQDPQMYQRLLVERNRNWLPRLEALFDRTGHAFVVVGAAHLVGPDGLLVMLKAKGYTVEQL